MRDKDSGHRVVNEKVGEAVLLADRFTETGFRFVFEVHATPEVD